MKNLILILLLLALGACGKLNYTIQLDNGKLITAQTLNDVDVVFNKGDTVVLQSTRRETSIYGKYVGVLPEHQSITYDSVTYFFTYQIGVILSNEN